MIKLDNADILELGSSLIMNVEKKLRNSDEVSLEFVSNNLTTEKVDSELKKIRDFIQDKGYKTKLKTCLPDYSFYTSSLDNKDMKYELVICRK